MRAYRWIVAAVAVAVVMMGLLAVPACADEPVEPGIRVQWVLPDVNMDGTPLTDLAGVRIYIGTEPGEYTQRVEVPGGEPGAAGSYWLDAAEYGLELDVVYYLNATVYNTAGLESDFTQEIAKGIRIAVPPAPPVLQADRPWSLFEQRIVNIDGKYVRMTVEVLDE